MRRKFTLLLVIALAFKAVTFGQQTSTTTTQATTDQDSYNKYSLPSLSAGGGIMTFFGDIGTYDSKVTHVGKFNSGAAFTLEQRIGSALGVSLNIAKGTLCENDNRPYRHLNFQTDVLQGNLGLTFHFDNDFIINRTSRFAPFITVGFGYMTFESRGDLRNANNLKYFYWPDGTIRNQNFDWENPQNGDTLIRDYSFETKLDSLKLYKHNSLIIPVGGGFNFKFSDKFEANISTTFYFTQTDAIDNLSYLKTNKFKFFDKHNDSYIFTNVTLQYNIGGKSKNKLDNRNYKDVNYRKLDKVDSDGDGVPDIKDKSPDTPTGVKVDKEGVPIDTDKDGVPDYLDKEPTTMLGAQIDENGVTLTAKMIEDKFIRDSLILAGVIGVDRDSTMSHSSVDSGMVSNQSQQYYNSIQNQNQNQNQNQYAVNTNNTNTNNTNTNTNNTNTNNTNTNTTNTNTTNTNEVTSAIGDVIYRVQIGSLATANSKNYFVSTFKVNEEIHVDAYQGAYKYSVGKFYTYATARAYANSLKARTGINSFVISYKNGTRIPVSDAKAITGQ